MRMTVFPNGKHDDQVDSTAQSLDWFKRPFPGQNAYQLMRMAAEEAEQRRKAKPKGAPPDPARGSMEWFALQEKRKNSS
jgi:hypothetical protein